MDPPPCPLPAPGAAEGIERNILGELLEYLQSMAGASPIRTFAYNLLSRDGYDNKEFSELLNTVLILTAALLESGKFQRGSQAAEFAVARMVEYLCVKLAFQYPVLQDMEPEMAPAAAEIEAVGRELGELVKRYNESLQQAAAWGGSNGVRQNPAGGWGSGARSAPTVDRWGNSTASKGSSTRWGASALEKTQPADAGVSLDIFKKDVPKSPKMSSDKPIRNEPMSGLSEFSALYTVTPPSEAPSRPVGRHGRAPRPTEHPTGDTVQMQSRTASEEPAVAQEPAPEVAPGEQWVLNSDKTEPTYLKVTPTVDGRQNMLYERGHCKPAYRITDNKVEATVTERESYMSAGYELHELTFADKDRGMFAKADKKPKEVIYNRDKLLKAEGEEISNVLSYYQEKLSGGQIGDTTLLSLEAIRDVTGDDNAVVVLNYSEKKAVNTNANIKEYLDAVKAASTPKAVSDAVEKLKNDHPYWGSWLALKLQELTNTILSEDFALDLNITNFLEDFSVLSGVVTDDAGPEVTTAAVEYAVSQVSTFLGAVGYIEGTEDEWGICTMTHSHCIIDVPMSASQLELSGGESIGRLTKTTAPELFRIIEGAVGDDVMHYYWLLTQDGTILELSPAPTGKGAWIVKPRDRIGH